MHRSFLYMVVGLSLCSIAFRVVGDKDTYVGYAYEKGNSTPVYSEEFTDHFVNGRHVETLTNYFNSDKKLIARRTLDFSHSPLAPDFTTEDLRTGFLEGAELENGRVRLFFRKDKHSPLEEKTIDVPQPMVIDGGFNQFIKSNWSRLADGEHMVFYFTVSTQLDFFKMRVYKTGMTSAEMKVKIEPDKTLIRWLAAPIVISYDRSTKRITSYEGKSNISNEDGSNFIIKLVYPKKGP